MELRDFFTPKEIEAMKEKIIERAAFANFMVDHTIKEDGSITDTYRSLAPDIQSAIEQETVKQVKEYVREVVDTVAKERVAAAVDRFSAALCDQLDKIASKTNWYWSIK